MPHTLNYLGVDLEVFYDYTPAEKSNRDYQGNYAYVEIWRIDIGGVDVTLLLEEKLEEIESLILNEILNPPL